jgi:Leucine-rich repeat (LRR) protein
VFQQPGEELSGRRTRLLPGWCGVPRGMQPGGGVWSGKTQTIKKHTFHNLEITSLSLSGKKITTIEAFVNLSQLKTLILDRKQVKELNPRSFVGLPHLDKFRGARNGILKLQKNVFEFLENRKVSEFVSINQLSTISCSPIIKQ